MRNARLKIFALIFFCQFLFATQTLANEMRIAVASNFFSTMKEIISEFELENLESSKAIKIVIIPGSSGKHYAQIINGAPFDLFFSADQDKTKMLEEKGIISGQSRFTYALGKLALWSPRNGFIDSDGRFLLIEIFDF